MVVFTKCISIACGGSMPLSFSDYARIAAENKPENILAICRVQRGSGHIALGSISTEVNSGSLLLLGSGESYTFTASGKHSGQPHRLRPAAVQQFLRLHSGAGGSGPHAALARGCELITEKDACYGEVMATVDTIWRAAEAGETSSPIMAVAMLWQLAAQLKRETERRGDTLGSIRETRNKERLAPAVNYTYQHYDQKITLADLAREANMSVPNFSSVFRETYGIPPMEYLARIRLQNAADLLQNTDKKIIDIAEECGFFSISNFIKAFNNGMGMSPSRYRKECGGPDKADKPADD